VVAGESASTETVSFRFVKIETTSRGAWQVQPTAITLPGHATPYIVHVSQSICGPCSWLPATDGWGRHRGQATNTL